MTTRRPYFAIIGALAGFLMGYFYATHYNRQAPATTASPAGRPGTAALPPGHPPLGPSEAEITESIQAADREPTNFEAQVKAGLTLYRGGRLEDALKYLERANALKPDDYDTLVQLGNVNFDLGDHLLEHNDLAQSNVRFAEASRWYERALVKNPRDVNVQTDYGLTFYKRQPRDLDRAITAYKKSLEIDPTHTPTLYNLTVALMEKGNFEEAEAMLRRLQEVAPSEPAVQNLRQELARRQSGPTS